MNFLKDFGYDISDYLSIQPEYGTMQDFDELIAKAKSLGMTREIFYLTYSNPHFNSNFLSLALALPYRHKNHPRLCTESLKVHLMPSNNLSIFVNVIKIYFQ